MTPIFDFSANRNRVMKSRQENESAGATAPARRSMTYAERFLFQKDLWLKQIRSVQDVVQDIVHEEVSHDFNMHLDGAGIHFRDWRKRRELTSENYPRSGEAVICRGVEFITGDILLCNRARSSDGMFTTLVDGPQSFAHVAIYVELEDQGRLFPAVLEIHHEGVRAVPLVVFVQENFSTYLELYRSRSLKSVARGRMPSVAREMLDEVHGFDIEMIEDQKTYLSCALVAAELFERSGARRFNGKSRYHKATMGNLLVLGNGSSFGRDLLMPDDFSSDPDFERVGEIDNARFPALVARALMRERMQFLWQNKALNAAKFPLLYWLARLMVRALQKRVWLVDRMVARIFGFPRASFPSGPATFIALTPFVETRIERGADRIEEFLVRNPELLRQANSWDGFSKLNVIKSLVAESMKPFEELFD